MLHSYTVGATAKQHTMFKVTAYKNLSSEDFQSLTGFPQVLCSKLPNYLFVFDLNFGTVKRRPHPLS